MAVVHSLPEKRGKPAKEKEKPSGFNQMNNKKVKCENPGKSMCDKRKRVTIYDNVETKCAVMERAKEVQANLAPEFPSTIKCMLPSHVTGGFWLGLAKKFCNEHLPKQDTMMVLEDESGKEFEAKYLVGKVGLSGGWRGFSIAHKLVEGDVVVFHLVKPSKFKVYIVRSNGSDEVDGALGLLKLEGSTRQIDIVKDIKICKKEADESSEPLTLDIPQENAQKNCLTVCGTDLGPASDPSENENEDLGSEVMDGIELSESVVKFKEVRSIEDFSILVNGLIINSAFTKQLKTKYYELCCSQKSFLHDHLLEGLNCRLVAGIIAETVNIADAIRACKLTTSRDHFLIWDKTLKAFEGMGMNVGFLCSRLDELLNLVLQSKRYKEVKLERDQVEEEKGILEAKLSEVNKRMHRLEDEIKTLDVNARRLESMFQEVVNAPW